MSFEDELRAQREHLRLGMSRAGRRYLDHGKLGEEVPEPCEAPGDTQLSHDDLLAAQRELAEQHNVSSARVRGMVMLATVQAGLGYSEAEQAAVLCEVMLSLERGQDAVSGEQIIELSGRGGGDTGIVGTFGYSDSGDEVTLAAGTTQETRGLRLAAGSGGQDSASAVLDRHPELSFMFRAGKTSSRKHPRKSGPGREVTTDDRAHRSDLDADPRDTRQPARGGTVHAKVRELIEGNPDLLSDGEGHEGGSGNKTYRPSPYRNPGISGKPQSHTT